MPRKETPETRGDKTSKTPMDVGDRGQNRPGAPEANAQKVDEAAARDEVGDRDETTGLDEGTDLDQTAARDESAQERR